MSHAAHDDEQIGRILSRREILTLLGLAGGGALAGCARPAAKVPTDPTSTTMPGASASGQTAGLPTPASEGLPTAAQAIATELPRCIVRPAQGAGPFYVDERLERSDLRADQATGELSAGLPLTLELRVSQIDGGSCAPLAGVLVDVWHCDAGGVYSGVDDGSTNSQGSDFLRGYQVSGEDGRVRFTTVYPGWYPGRAVHIHFKIRSSPEVAPGYDFTSQLYFDDALSEQVFLRPPYAARGVMGTSNERDGGYRNGGEQLLLDLRETDEGYAASFDIGLQLG